MSHQQAPAAAAPNARDTTATTPDHGGSSGGGSFSWIVRPADQINYNFISGMYGGGCALAILLYGLERSLQGYYSTTASKEGQSDSGGENDESAMAEFARQMEGLYLVFIPFFPCLLWSLVVRSRWLDMQDQKEKKE